MANIEKYSHEAVATLLGHFNRTHSNYSNKDIDLKRSKDNDSFEMNHNGLSDYEYYKMRLGECYLYGRGSKRGSKREKDAVTAAAWVITAPKEIAGDREKEDAFFKATFDFVSHRYGEENIINNAIHRDESERGSAHIHITFIPITKLDHDEVRYRTISTKQSIQTETGRYEFKNKFKLDEDGQKIPVKTYARMTDYYDEKVSAKAVLNSVELKKFHPELQKYLTEHGIEGCVHNGSTGGLNVTVEELKELTNNTGLTIEDVREKMTKRTLLESLVERDSKVHALEQLLQEKEIQIESLLEKVEAKDISAEHLPDHSEKAKELADAQQKSIALEKELNKAKEELLSKDKELAATKAKLKELEATRSEQTRTTGWNREATGWGERTPSSWGQKQHDIEIEQDQTL